MRSAHDSLPKYDQIARGIVAADCYTRHEDFSEPDAVFPEPGDEPDALSTLDDLKKIAP